jgi:tetratricopeptide (TPR) repeat protein
VIPVQFALLLLLARFVAPFGGPSAALTVQSVAPDFDSIGMHPEVRAVFEEARERVAHSPEDASAWWKLGALFDAHDLHRQAEVCYRRAHELDPEDFRAVYLLAIVSDQLGYPLEVTVPLFREAIELRPKYAPVFLNMGNALARQGRAAEARDAYEEALEIDGGFYAAHRALGQLLLLTGEVEEAKAHLLTAWEGAPDDSGLNASLAQAYMRLGDRESAREYAERARSASPSLAYHDDVREEVMAMAVSIGARLERARRAFEIGEVGLAVDELERLLRLHPKHAEAHGMLGGILLGEGRLDEALPHLEQAVALYPRDVDKRLLLGQALLQASRDDPNRLKAALQHLRFACKLDPEDAEAREFLAIALARRGRLEPAIAAFERAAAGGRVLSEEAYCLWGSSLGQAGRLSEAYECFRGGLEHLPDSALLCFNLAVALEQLGRTEEAIATYLRAEEMGTTMPARERANALRQQRDSR